MTLEQKNEKAFSMVDHSDTLPLQFELLQAIGQEPDWRMKSLVGYHLMRRYFDNESFTPEVELDMENVPMPLPGRYWKYPSCALFPACQVYAMSYAGHDAEDSHGYLINLCSFVEDEPVIAYRHACEDVLSGPVIVKGLVPYDDAELQRRYPDWTFYKVDRSLTDDMTAVIASEFAHVHRVEIAHLSLEDHSLHRIFDTN
jgi:hypothetical protein